MEATHRDGIDSKSARQTGILKSKQKIHGSKRQQLQSLKTSIPLMSNHTLPMLASSSERMALGPVLQGYQKLNLKCKFWLLSSKLPMEETDFDL